MKNVTILMSDRRKTEWMQNLDIFESFKVVVMPAVVAEVVDDYGDRHVKALRVAYNKAPYGLIAVYDDEKVYYRDPAVKVLSDGDSFVLLDDVLPKSR